MTDIKSMGLYRQVDRIIQDLEAVGVSNGDPLRVDDLTPFDQYHYEGTDSVDQAAQLLRADADAIVLDVGSGLGGPARYLADRTGCRTVALELQADLHETATSLTERCGLAGRIDHVHGDVLAGELPADTFSGVMSMLCFLHIPDRPLLFSNVARVLQPGGVLFIDDYYQRTAFTDQEQQALADKVFCPYLPELETYVAHVTAAGFTNVRTIDKTDDWTDFVVDRSASFRAAQRETTERYGAETVASLNEFYSTVADLFANGSLGGVRLVADLAK